jgi:hypothetical protein
MDQKFLHRQFVWQKLTPEALLTEEAYLLWQTGNYLLPATFDRRNV